jgi:hypothetical protein
LGICPVAIGFGVTEENQHGVTDEQLVDGARVVVSDCGNFSEVFIEHQ